MDTTQETTERRGRYGWVWVWAALIVFVAFEMARVS